jgi:hypothetical protein
VGKRTDGLPAAAEDPAPGARHGVGPARGGKRKEALMTRFSLAAAVLGLGFVLQAGAVPAAEPLAASTSIIPPYIQEEIAKRGTTAQRERALRQLEHDRKLVPGAEGRPGAEAALLPRGVYDARSRTYLPGYLVWGGPPAAVPSDPRVQEAVAGQNATRGFWSAFAGLNLAMPATVHYGRRYNNAFWNGAQMVFGDGDAAIFKPFTCCIEIIAHERAHGIVGNRMAYRNQAGALNESMSDVFGALTAQWARGQTAAQASWLVGEGLFMPGINGRALRDMQEPGTAYDDRLIGRDPQPDTMADFVVLPDTASGDYGGVHYNSGIPNRAFVLTALSLGGKSWERAGRVWYAALTSSYRADLSFADFAALTVAKAQTLYGSTVATTVAQSWRTVGVRAAARRDLVAAR